MYAWLVGRMLRRGYAQALSGNPRMLMALAADDIEFTFPGRNSFAGTLHGKGEVGDWLQRFASFQPAFTIVSVLVSGPPWDMRVAARFRDAIGDDYDNQGVEYLTIRRGKLRMLEVFLDTERISAWESRHPELIHA